MTTRNISWASLFIALSVVGAMIKVPAIIGSIALDSFPALVSAVVLGSGVGAFVGGLGHLLSALIGGMPLGPFHFIVAAEMAFLVWAFGALYSSGKRVLASITFFIGNAFIAPLPFMFLMSVQFYIALLPSLIVGSLVNVLLAVGLTPRIVTAFKHRFYNEEEVKS